MNPRMANGERRMGSGSTPGRSTHCRRLLAFRHGPLAPDSWLLASGFRLLAVAGQHPRHLPHLLTAWLALLLVAPLPAAPAAEPGTEAAPPATAKAAPAARVLKVLPHYLDREGRHSINPSLFDRDAYQFELRRDPKLRSGLRFDVLWKGVPGSPAAFDLKLELRGSHAPEQAPVVVRTRAFSRGGFSQWTRVPILGKDYEALGELLAWRVTLWRGDTLVAEQTSFLW